MKVILTKDVPGVGRAGDVKEVSDGYARNFLVGRGLGLPATQGQLDKVGKERREKDAKAARQEAQAAKLAGQISAQPLIIKKPANGTRLFAGVHEQDILNGIAGRFGLELTPKQVKILNPIKTVGNHPVDLKLGGGQTARITVTVEPQ